MRRLLIFLVTVTFTIVVISYFFPFWDKGGDSQVPTTAVGGFGYVDKTLGSFIYEYPIEIPSGLGNAQPNIQLIYNSQNNTSRWLGVGWELSFGSKIIRVGKTGGAPNLDETDRYSLDGNKLVLIKPAGDEVCPYSSVAEGECIYRTSNESFVKISHNGYTNGSSATSWWEVIDTEGTVYKFGGGLDYTIQNTTGNLAC